jgi:hypothetical protein
LILVDTAIVTSLLSFLLNPRDENEEDVVRRTISLILSVMLVTSSQQMRTSFFEVVQKLGTSYWSEES